MQFQQIIALFLLAMAGVEAANVARDAHASSPSGAVGVGSPRKDPVHGRDPFAEIDPDVPPEVA